MCVCVLAPFVLFFLGIRVSTFREAGVFLNGTVHHRCYTALVLILAALKLVLFRSSESVVIQRREDILTRYNN